MERSHRELLDDMFTKGFILKNNGIALFPSSTFISETGMDLP